MDESITHMLALLPNWLGDVAMCTPALRALHARFPQAALTVAGRASACDLVRGLPWFSAILPIPAQPGFLELRRQARQLRPHARDLAVVFPHSFRAALLAAMTRAKRRAGYDRDRRGFLLTDRVPPYRENGAIQPIYMSEEYLGLVTALGCEDDGMGLELRADPAACGTISRQLANGRPHVGIAPGGAFGPSKRWLPERFAAVADALAQQAGAQCVLITGPGEETIRDAVLAHARMPLLQCDGGRPSIGTLKATIASLDLLVGNDSGPRHVAVAFHVPTVCVMGPTSPRYSEGPYERGRVVRVTVDCGPCQKAVCNTDHRCMTQIPAQRVLDAALDILERVKC